GAKYCFLSPQECSKEIYQALKTFRYLLLDRLG
ncbi:MAG: hypothetical protein ACI9QN_001424, partial [Arcticibacterium sp.]